MLEDDPVYSLLCHLQESLLDDSQAEAGEIYETHISWVLLVDDTAYKLKKAVNFGFLDYSTLEKRKAFCEEELRLNRRTAPELYQEIVPIGGTYEHPLLDVEPAIEYALKMRRFPQDALLTRLLANEELTEDHIITLAKTLAAFHAGINVAEADSNYGTAEAVFLPIQENFKQTRQRISDQAIQQRLNILQAKTRDFFETHRSLFDQRKASGFIRDCHGDLHLNNILWLDDRPVLFDCIEFNPSLRIIDVISEIAFLVMDMEEHGRADLANCLLNNYLEQTGDYSALRLLRFYQGYRAMVRAKVAILRLEQGDLDVDERQLVLQDFEGYLGLAERYAEMQNGRLIITHGLSASGKTTFTQALLMRPGMIRIRSDVERKRLFGLRSEESSHSDVGNNIYTTEATQQTYDCLAEWGRAVIESGFSVIIDAAFLKRVERDRFRVLAQELNVPFTLVSFQAEPAVLRKWMKQRQTEGKDASEATLEVLDRQLQTQEVLATDEQDVDFYLADEVPDDFIRFIESVS